MPDPSAIGSMQLVEPSHRTLVLLSGGIDSSVMAAWLQVHGHELEAAFVDFGQGNLSAERPAAEKVWKHLSSKPLLYIDLTGWRQSWRDSNGKDRISMGSLARNPFLAMAAIPQARIYACAWIALGSTLDDATAPDCNSEFVAVMNELLITLRQPERLIAPWLALDRPWNKTDIVRWAFGQQHLGLEFIDLTHSCWRNKPGGCGECQPCITRKRAIEEAKKLS